MGSIRFSAASMFGSLSDVVGTKSGLALNRQQLGELLGRDERFREFQELGDDDWVRIESVTAEEMIEFLLFSVGRLERMNNPLPLAHLYHKYKGDPAKLKVVYSISKAFIDFLGETLANPDLKRGDEIDPTAFIRRCLASYGRLGLEISNDLITNYAIQLEIKSHFPSVSEWTDTAELDELFRSEGLATQYGQFFDQRYIDYLHRNFDDIVGLGIDDPVWHPTAFTTNRERLLEGEVAGRFLAAVLDRPEVRRLLSDEHFSVDGTLVEAWARMKSFRAEGWSGRRAAGQRAQRRAGLPWRAASQREPCLAH
jgi:hypothetical protein